MTHRVEFRQAAVNDLTALYERVVTEAGRTRAGAYIDRIEAMCMGLETFPKRGSIRNHLYPGLRIIGFERSASIAFVVHADVVDILRILPRGMDFPNEWDSD